MPLTFSQTPGLVAYITAGDPDLATTRDIALAAIDAGADVLELGVPFSDPLADGPVIQRASARAVANGVTLLDVLSLANGLRQARPSCGLILFSYLNPIVRLCERSAERVAALKGSAEGEGKYERNAGGIGNYAHVRLRVAPGAPGKGLMFADDSPRGNLPAEYRAAIHAGVRTASENSRLAGVAVSLLGGSYDEERSNELSFQIAAGMAFREAANKAGSTLQTPNATSMKPFCAAASEAGLDGVLLTDLIVEEADEYLVETARHNLAPVFLAAPTSPDTRLQAIAYASKGFVYAVSRVGITGTQANIAEDAPTLVARLRPFTEPKQLPIAVGFGISTAEHVRSVAQYADAAVVGSAIVRLIEQSTPAEAPARVGEFIRGLRA